MGTAGSITDGRVGFGFEATTLRRTLEAVDADNDCEGLPALECIRDGVLVGFGSAMGVFFTGSRGTGAVSISCTDRRAASGSLLGPMVSCVKSQRTFRLFGNRVHHDTFNFNLLISDPLTTCVDDF